MYYFCDALVFRLMDRLMLVLEGGVVRFVLMWWVIINFSHSGRFLLIGRVGVGNVAGEG